MVACCARRWLRFPKPRLKPNSIRKRHLRVPFLRLGSACGSRGSQSIGASPCCSNSWLVCEKWRQPKNPRWAESGDGCGAFNTWWRLRSIKLPFFCACDPQSRNTMPSRFSFSAAITLSVKVSQPSLAWECAWPPSTVNTVFNNSTPCSAQLCR